MNAKIQPAAQSGNSLIAAVLGVVALLLVAGVLSGLNTRLPLIDTDRAAFIALGVLGFAMCTMGGIGVVIQKRGWADPITIIGTLMGVLALALIVLVLLGVRLPLIATDRDAFVALAGIGVLKVLIEGADHLRK
jgi:predicted tellurium resistance membrane protein TerC